MAWPHAGVPSIIQSCSPPTSRPCGHVFYSSPQPDAKPNEIEQEVSWFLFTLRKDVSTKNLFVKKQNLLRGKITALYSQLAFDGKRVWAMTVVLLWRADTSPQHKLGWTIYSLSLEKWRKCSSPLNIARILIQAKLSELQGFRRNCAHFARPKV
jgi:hypothetical protein